MGNIRFEHISVRWAAKKLLQRHIAGHNLPGRWVAFVGATGCGKTVLMKPTGAGVRSDRRAGAGRREGCEDARTARPCGKRLPYVPQSTFLFSDTLRENVRMSKRMSRTRNSTARSRIVAREQHDLAAASRTGCETMSGEKGVMRRVCPEKQGGAGCHVGVVRDRAILVAGRRAVERGHAHPRPTF